MDTDAGWGDSDTPGIINQGIVAQTKQVIILSLLMLLLSLRGPKQKRISG